MQTDSQIEQNTPMDAGCIPQTTFFQDFGIAEIFGVAAIQETYERAMNCKWNYKFLTELALVLGKKCLYYYQKNNKFSELYAELFYRVQAYAYDNLEGEELSYFQRNTA